MRISFSILALLLLTGCTSTSTTNTAKPVPIDRSRPYLEILEEKPPTGSVTAAELHVLHDGNWTYHVIEGDGAGSTITHERRKATRFNAQWSDFEQPSRTQFWQEDSDGTIRMTATIAHSDKAISLFEPPLILAYADLPAGEKRETETPMRVVAESNLKTQRESGTASRTIEYTALIKLRTPLGEFTAKRVEVRFLADLKFADAEKTTTMYVVPELGVIAEERSETITILLAQRKSRQTLVLIAGP